MNLCNNRANRSDKFVDCRATRKSSRNKEFTGNYGGRSTNP